MEQEMTEKYIPLESRYIIKFLESIFHINHYSSPEVRGDSEIEDDEIITMGSRTGLYKFPLELGFAYHHMDDQGTIKEAECPEEIIAFIEEMLEDMKSIIYSIKNCPIRINDEEGAIEIPSAQDFLKFIVAYMNHLDLPNLDDFNYQEWLTKQYDRSEDKEENRRKYLITFNKMAREGEELVSSDLENESVEITSANEIFAPIQEFYAYTGIINNAEVIPVSLNEFRFAISSNYNYQNGLNPYLKIH